MRKSIVILLALCVLLGLSPAAMAEGYAGRVDPESVLLLNVDTGTRLFEKNAQERVYPASTTKILTTLVVLEHVSNLDDVVTVGAEELEGIYEGDDSTLVPMLEEGEKISVRDLLYGLMLVSGNETATTLAKYVGGSIQGFVDMMNEKATALGMYDSHFTNPHGVQDEDHYTTPDDMAKLTVAALNNPELCRIVSTAEYTISGTNLNVARKLQNSNVLLKAKEDHPGTEYPYATGMKTGYTPTAGGCLVSTAEKDGVRLACLIYGDESEEQQERWRLSRSLLDYGFSVSVVTPAPTPEPESTAVPEVQKQAQAEEETEAPKKSGRGIWILLSMLLALVMAGGFGLALLREREIRRYLARARKRKVKVNPKNINHVPSRIMYGVGVLSLILMVLCIGKARKPQQPKAELPPETTQAPVVTPVPTEEPRFAPHKTAASDPAQWGIRWETFRGDTQAQITRTSSVTFGDGSDYFALPGIAGFRGDNWRSGATYGTAEVTENIIAREWTVEIGSLPTTDGSAWTGSGWTGQPIIVQWPEATRRSMNLYPEKQEKDGLVEVIYATLDGSIYFLDLEDGSYTRDPMYLGMCFKGAGAIDPRGYPILYVGSGDENVEGERPHMYVISLIDCSVLYTCGDEEMLALRADHDYWCAFDAGPLVDAETDTLIWPGESGVLYSIHLNSSYDPATGKLSLNPEAPVKARYDTARSGEENYWYGIECSPVAVDHYLYASENGGMFFCVDLDTMELVWAQDTLDDSNSTPVFEPDGATGGYIYTAPSLHWTRDEDMCGTIPIFKLDAVTGEIVWRKDYECCTVDEVSGGVQSTPLLGKKGTSMEGMIYYPIARTPDFNNGLLVALDTRTGNEVWRMDMEDYTWSSPVAVYGKNGKGYIVLCDSGGTAFLLDGATGTMLDYSDAGYLVEASPAVYGDMVVVGTRGCEIIGFRVR